MVRKDLNEMTSSLRVMQGHCRNMRDGYKELLVEYISSVLDGLEDGGLDVSHLTGLEWNGFTKGSHWMVEKKGYRHIISGLEIGDLEEIIGYFFRDECGAAVLA